MFAMLSRASIARPSVASLLERAAEPLARGGRLEAHPELRRLADTTSAPKARARVVLPLEEGPGSSTAVTAPANAATDASAIAAMIAQLADPALVSDPSLALAARQALQTLASVYGGETSGRVYEALSHWMAVAGGLMRAPTTAASTSSGPRANRTSGDLAATSVPYEQLPEQMKGGTSSANGLPVIIVRDASELASLPMWKDMHPAAAQSYRERLAEALRNESGSVMGFAGFEIEVVGTNGVERGDAPTTPAKPYVSNADIAAFVKANLDSPGRIADAMVEYGVSFDRIEEATGYSRRQIVDYVMASSCKELIALL